MRREAGKTEKDVNHSLRATALYNADVPERLIRDVTGNESIALQLYEHTSLAQKEAIPTIFLQGMLLVPA